MGASNEEMWFDPAGTSYVPRFNVTETLLYDATTNIFQLIELNGSITQYDGTTGAFQSKSDPAGNQIAVVSYTSNYFNFTEVQRTYTSGGSSTIESFLYTYADSTVAFPVLSSVLLRRQVDGGDWTNVSQALYTYYGDGEVSGSLNDLQTVETQVWENDSWTSTGTSYYRYYLGRNRSPATRLLGNPCLQTRLDLGITARSLVRFGRPGIPPTHHSHARSAHPAWPGLPSSSSASPLAPSDP
jgi:hypothetical protein